MNYIHAVWTQTSQFYATSNPIQLLEKYGSPLYVYNETILRTRCRELKKLLSYPKFRINYSAKANTNLSILRIIHDEGLMIDAMSPGEIFIELKAGFKPEEILFVCNNVSDEEMRYAIDAGIMISVDSLAQLERYGKLVPGGAVAVRFNPGVGAGHHEKVVTAGKNTKFGIEASQVSAVQSLQNRYNLRICGLNQHIGSLFMDSESYLEAASFLLTLAERFPDIEFVDFGGGFGIPYHKEAGEKPLDLTLLGKRLQELVETWVNRTGRRITVKIEPGRFTVAECGVLLGQVHSIKMNGDRKYIGTDIGFNVLARPLLYNAHHDIEIYSMVQRQPSAKEPVTIVGNICETGDILAKDRNLPEIFENDTVAILDSGAYGLVMSSNYNCRLRPAEVLITSQGKDILIRHRETVEDLIRYFPDLKGH
ncbi:MAG: diaminopimelate decarboxylase [Chitinivibrionales bacterium]|nr:diaminopimelate decarboxylase [Chitinivibrionales bacterium]